MRSTRICIDNRIYVFSPVDIGGQSRRKTQKKVILSDFDLYYLSTQSINTVIYKNSSIPH